MKASDALQGLNRLFLDSSPMIYYIDANPEYLSVMDSIFDGIKLIWDSGCYLSSNAGRMLSITHSSERFRKTANLC